MLDYLIGIFLALLALAIPLAMFILSLVAFLRSRRIRELERRLAALEQRWGEPAAASPFTAGRPASAVAAEADRAAQEPPAAVVTASAPRQPIQWEYLIGQKAFGWAAVALAIISLSFFLKYSYENNWVGAAGRVAIAVMAGAVLMVVGRRYYHLGWRLFSQMVTSAGIVGLYLATYSAFGFYHLLPSLHAGIFLTAIVALSAACAVRYNSSLIALVAVIGGLSCPLLMQTEHDTFVALFSYLAALNLGVGVIWLLRRWPGLGTLTLLGTQLQYWAWYAGHYHPEKFGWALGFQAVLFAIYFAQDLLVPFREDVRWRIEATARSLLNAILWFAAFYVLMDYDYSQWLGISAIVMAALYALSARGLLQLRSDTTITLATFLAISAGFIAVAIPLESHARWIAFGWSVAAFYIWWFSCRADLPALRVPAGALFAISVLRLLLQDLWAETSVLRMPLLNNVTLPSIGVICCLFAAAYAANAYRQQPNRVERALTVLLNLGAVFLLWLALTVDTYQVFDDLADYGYGTTYKLRWLAQMSVSILWTVYASVLLAVGFQYQRSLVRWMGIAVFTLTIFKVVIVDMSELSEIYRILAFFILAASLAGAARVYQRTRSAGRLGAAEESTDDVE